MSTVKKAISFRELKEELNKLAEDMYENYEFRGADVLTDIIERIDHDDGGHMSRETGVPGLDDAHKMPSREYWRYEFTARAMQAVLSNDALLLRLDDAAEGFCITWAETMIEALEEDEG